MTYNILTCEGFEVFGKGIMGGNCNLTWTLSIFVFAIVFFAAAILRRQCEDGALSGQDFNFPFALILGLGSSFLITTFTGYPQWSLLGGFLGVLIGGFLIGKLIGGRYS